MKNKLRLGIDVGGTKIEAVIINQKLETLARERVPTLREEGYAPVLQRIITLVRTVCAKVQVAPEDLETIGIGLPGTVAPHSRQMLNGNTALFVGHDFAKDIAQALNLKRNPKVANDANCFALAEALVGSGKTFAEKHQLQPKDLVVVGIILGTGVGGGLVINGSIYEGVRGAGLEVGHLQIDPLGEECFCGRIGCSETILSGTGIEATYKKLTNKTKSAAAIFLEENSEDKEFVRDYQKKLQQFILNIANTIDPHFIVLGGGVSNQPSLYKDLDSILNQQFFLKDRAPTVLKNELGDSAGVYGAALL